MKILFKNDKKRSRSGSKKDNKSNCFLNIILLIDSNYIMISEYYLVFSYFL